MDSIRITTTERDSAREDLKEMTASRATLQKDKESFAATMREKLNQL